MPQNNSNTWIRATLTCLTLVFAVLYSNSAGAQTDPTLETPESTTRFLTQTTFGPTREDVSAWTGREASDWILDQFGKSMSLNVPLIRSYIDSDPRLEDEFNLIRYGATSLAFWRNAITADDQLRQRMAFAPSQILVVSNANDGPLAEIPFALGGYQDILTRHAFGNYRDLLEDVTYSPAMGFYLTYLGNRKADPETGRMPDENYAREILQLFTLGLVELNSDGTPRLDGDGNDIELYDNMDITGLAKVFTGLFHASQGQDIEFDSPEFEEDWLSPMIIREEAHSSEAKSFLGTTIQPGTGARESITLALDHIMDHPNIGPFISRQLIQRFTTSAPKSAYVSRVADAFNSGRYILPNGTQVGDGRKGDLKATLSAILLDRDNAFESAFRSGVFGKIREPILRFTNWARTFGVNARHPEYVFALYDTSGPDTLNQHPYRSRSVFNFYRPGYIAPNTETGARELTAPELQIVNATSIVGYSNFMSYFIFGIDPNEDNEELQAFFDVAGADFEEEEALTAFQPNYDRLKAMARNPRQLVRQLDETLTYGTLSIAVKRDIVAAVSAIPVTADEEDTVEDRIDQRVRLAVLMVMTSPDYLVQK